jgi:hypothetical protein
VAIFVTNNIDAASGSMGAAPGSEWRDVSYANDGCECLSGLHVVLMTTGAIMHIGNLGLKYISYRVLTFIPNRNLLNARYGNIDILYEVVIYVLIVVRSFIVIYRKDDYELVKAYYYVILVIFLILFFIN